MKFTIIKSKDKPKTNLEPVRKPSKATMADLIKKAQGK